MFLTIFNSHWPWYGRCPFVYDDLKLPLPRDEIKTLVGLRLDAPFFVGKKNSFHYILGMSLFLTKIESSSVHHLLVFETITLYWKALEVKSHGFSIGH